MVVIKKDKGLADSFNGIRQSLMKVQHRMFVSNAKNLDIGQKIVLRILHPQIPNSNLILLVMVVISLKEIVLLFKKGNVRMEMLVHITTAMAVAMWHQKSVSSAKSQDISVIIVQTGEMIQKKYEVK